MRYRLFMYGTTAKDRYALCVDSTNRALLHIDNNYWRKNVVTDYMERFDIDRLSEELRSKLGDLCRIVVKYPPEDQEQIPYLYISTDYLNAARVLAFALCVAAENDLVLYDAERDVTHFRTVVNDSFIKCAERASEIKDAIYSGDLKLWKIRKTGSFYETEYGTYHNSYTVTVRKTLKSNKTAKEATESFYELLRAQIADGEKLICSDRCFKVMGEWYKIEFTLEWGFKDRPQIVGYVENDVVHTRQLHRMSTEQAFDFLNGFSDYEKDVVFDRMRFREMIEAFPNPADRFVHSVNITKRLKKQKIEAKYCGVDWCYSPDMSFHIVPDDIPDDEKEAVSCFSVEGDFSLSFILPIVEDVYPYVKDRYHDEYHLPYEVWNKLIDRVNEIKKLVLQDTYGRELAPYIDRFCLSILESDDEKYGKEKPSKTDVLYAHRYEVADFYDIFSEWLRAQREYNGFSGYFGSHRMMSVVFE